MDSPEAVTNTRLWRRLSHVPEYIHTIKGIRVVAEALGRQIERLLPEYTDHSLRHMDALWAVGDAVIREDEAAQCTTAEIFLLTASFYVHDLGMAIACTSTGADSIRNTIEYRSAFQRLSAQLEIDTPRADTLALRSAVRDLHAAKAPSLAVDPLPGLDRYLIENTEMRERWAYLIGEIAASHHWTLEVVHKKLGRRDAVPTASDEPVDLGYVACMLRIIDFAHINRQRALNLDRALRSEISADSIAHWEAQAYITGPMRDANQLVYGCTTPLTNIEAWWLFFDLATGLDIEIRAVRDYLSGRKPSSTRFSLQGVRGVESPEAFSSYVVLDSEIAPIDIRVQPRSMERVVQLLGGAALYRGDRMAPIRELIQNCRDAIALRQAAESLDQVELTPGRIDISLDATATPPILRVRDNGIGMPRSVVKNHLIGVASDFWRSAEYARDFGRVADAGFRPIGRFGIGFLSVFMLGEYVEVETERAGSHRILLRLRGLGHRGELRERPPTGRVGTEIRISLTESSCKMLSLLPEIVRARAPMLPYIVSTSVKSETGNKTTVIEPRWWATASAAEFQDFLDTWDSIARTGSRPSQDASAKSYNTMYSSLELELEESVEQLEGWPGARPESVEDTSRLMSCGGKHRDGILQCSYGIAIEKTHVNDVAGMLEIGEAKLTADRSTIAERDERSNEVVISAVASLKPRLQDALNELEYFGLVPARHRFLRHIAKSYDTRTLLNTALRWIPIMEPPGNLIHRSRQEVVAKLKSETALIVATGLSPAGAYGHAAAHVKTAELGRLLLLSLSYNEFRVDYKLEQKLEIETGANKVTGSLSSVCETAGVDDDNLVMLGAALACVAESWEVDPESLRSQNWELTVHYFKSSLWAHLRRP